MSGGYILWCGLVGFNAEAQLLLLYLGKCRSKTVMNDDILIDPECIRNNGFV